MCGQRDDRKAYPECILFLFFSNVSGEHPLFNHQRSLDPSVQIKPPKWHCIHFSISLYSCASIYIHTHTHADTQTHTHTHTHTPKTHHLNFPLSPHSTHIIYQTP